MLLRHRTVANVRSRWKAGRRSTSGGSSSSSSSSSYAATGPSAPLKSWERGAKLVRNTTVENRYLEHIREVHDPSQHLKTIEDELKGTIGKALGKQGQKVLMYSRLMDEERLNYESLEREIAKSISISKSYSNGNGDLPQRKKLRDAALAHNRWREDCLHARWELIVHRQAVGFTVGNHKFVQEKFPIGDPLPVENDDDDGGGDTDNTDGDECSPSDSDGSQHPNQPKRKRFTDQLDWWSRIGRWK